MNFGKAPARLKPCKVRGCGVRFLPRNSMQCVCSPTCAQTWARAQREQAETEKRRQERNSDRERKARLKTRSEYVKEAQVAFNAYIRARDCGLPCICCGLPLGDGSVGGYYDAGHYRSTGSAPHLRYNEANCHAQRKQCNRYGGGRAVDYRIGLIQRIGLAAVEALEADHEPRRYSISDLIEIRDTYRRKARELEKQSESSSNC